MQLVHPDYGKGVSLDCFTYVYCAIAEYGELSVADLKSWYDIPSFKTYLKTITTKANNAPAVAPGVSTLRHILKVGRTYPISISEIETNWKKALCKLSWL